MVDDVGLGAFVWSAVVMGAEVDIYLAIFELLPG